MAITEKLKDIANAIRNKTGTSELMRLDEMDDLILEINQTSFPKYNGPTNVIPNFDTKILPTENTSIYEDIVIEPIPLIEVSNQANGKTLII